MRIIIAKVCLTVLLSLASLVGGASVRAEVTFKGKTVNLIINSNAGGGTDLQARLVGGAIAKHLPGEPRIIFNNLPGGGGIKANNYFVEQAKREQSAAEIQAAGAVTLRRGRQLRPSA